MTVKNMRELKQALMKKAQKAMMVSSEKILSDMYEETGSFYTSGEPTMYKRTGALGDTPKTTAIITNGNSVSFEAYLDKNHQYTTGSNPDMQQVLELANDGTPFTTKNGYPARAAIGQKGFWERANEKMKKTFNDTMKSFFK